MKKCIALCVAVTLAVAMGDGRAADPASVTRPETGQVGRYQISGLVSLDGRIILVDTVTGQCWERTLDGDWRDLGSPMRADLRKPARPPQEPPTLELPAKSVELTVVQREERAIPGSNGSVRIRLGDITEGQVLLAVVTTDKGYLLETTSVPQGGKVEFSVGKKKYAVHVMELRNFLIGDDFAKLNVTEAPEKNSSDKGRDPDRPK